ESLVIEAVACDAQGREGKDRIEVYLGEADLIELDGPEGIVRTLDATYTISGRVLRNGVKVTVNGAAVPVANRRFRVEVPLQEGFNRIDIVASFAPAGGKKEFRQVITRQVVREKNEIELVVASPEDGSYLKAESVVVTGWVKGPSPLRLTVNGLLAEVSPDGSFCSQPIMLAEGENRIEIEARAKDGRTKKVELVVFADRTPPAITLFAPAEGAVLNTSLVTISGRLEEANPACLLINGRAVEVVNAEFSLCLELPEGVNRLTVYARDLAGHTATLSREVIVDTVPPLPFTLQGPHGYINNNRPEISFEAKDETSGIAAYYLRLDGGDWQGPVTSPYRFEEPLPDGEHFVEVKAVDYAGWETVSEPLRFIVDTVPPEVPAGFSAVSGPGRITLNWEPDPDDPAAFYLLRREPAFPEGERRLAGELSRYLDEGLTDGEAYTYRLRAVDRAGNIGEWTQPVSRVSGYQETAYDPAQEATLAFDQVKVELPAGALPEPAVLLALAAPEEMAPLPEEAEGVTPIGEPILLGQLVGDELVEVEFQEPVRLVFTYDPNLLPEGTDPSALHVYYYDEATGLWVRAGEEEVDPTTNTVSVLTTHFSVYQLVANPYAAPSLGAYLEEGPSPSADFLENHRESVSVASGQVNVQVIDFRIPGRAGMDLVFSRILDLNPDPINGRHYPGFGRWRPDLPEICTGPNGQPQLYLGGGRVIPIPKWEGKDTLLYFETRRDGLPVRVELHRRFG
ncbi:MAG: hypothetical protein K6U03_08710, partial [Firmicutes bacterium]|nr:hypothetical protein [Bacillota bacterium]